MPRTVKVKSVATLETVQEIGVYIHRFHNLDLFKQGWYRIKITVRWEDSESLSFGIPASVVQYEASLDDSSAAIHEFRIPPKALIGLHSYCPVHFDALHAVLVDGFGGVAFLDTGNVSLVKALLTSRDILVEELQKISKAINEALDISEFVSIMSNMKLLNSVLQVNQFAIDVEVVGQGKPQNGLKGGNEALDFLDVEKLHSLSQNELDNKSRILGFLRDAWVKDRKAEWSIWMLYSKVEMPHHYINSKSEESSHRGVHRRVSSLWKLPDDPLQTAATRAELHRRSIEQMRINNRSVQDMQIFGDLLHTPIVIVEHVMNVPRRCPSANSLLRHIGSIDSDGLPIGLSSDTIGKKFATQSNARVLKIVVFVHGFQACLDNSGPSDWSSVDIFDGSGFFIMLTFSSLLIDNNILLKWSVVSSLLLCLAVWICHEIQMKVAEFCTKLKGHHLDLRLVRNQWLLIDPKVEFLMSEANEDKTFGDFREMGHRLAKEDGYVPYHSARIESCQAASRDTSKKGKLFLEMLNACLDQIRANSMQHRVFMRCDVNFDASTQGKNLDSIIGRAAHIEFLDSDIFARFIMWSFPDLFR
ncbi:hypothetical protein JHK85_009721 [Glycine max]|nr:hypothetical protein JHK85_009721 [Glycine max]